MRLALWEGDGTHGMNGCYRSDRSDRSDPSDPSEGSYGPPLPTLWGAPHRAGAAVEGLRSRLGLGGARGRRGTRLVASRRGSARRRSSALRLRRVAGVGSEGPTMERRSCSLTIRSLGRGVSRGARAEGGCGTGRRPAPPRELRAERGAWTRGGGRRLRRGWKPWGASTARPRPGG